MFCYKRFVQFLFILMMTALLTACGSGSTAADPNVVTIVQPKKPTVILVFGDSTSQGYGIEEYGTYYEDVPPGLIYADLLRSRLKAEKIDAFAPVTVINASLGSEFAFEAIKRLPDLLDYYKPTHVLLAHGTNDSRALFPLDSISNSFLTMINMVRNSGAKPMLADVTLTIYGKDFANAYSKMVKDTAYIGAATYVPILEDIIYNPKYVLNDGYGYHQNEAAQPFMMNSVWKKLMPLLE